ncbi:hypothetical protein, conserved [Trypanosoma brucei brucei TREU927]|uniref:Uncharacterized protein n=1 Tax=Trypanosoma brucei brucei (strain 927/4 GUTat10.1) TaxID=185431 RepID=Q586S4_TRYB2|nr:hypothetical protein, conserved [Trypanosoma brucei brucei TREU927]AAQ15939.1 hypothetical protein, conserved [Trypanosoma brucei brucei TREU927]AAX80162.1 hypothetical protein, conserved [Trypanosoma brucei]
MEERKGHDRTLVKRHAFGVKADVSGCVCWVEEGTLLYPIGKTAAMHNLNTNTQRFFETSQRSGGITALAVSANKKFIAMAESGAAPQVQVFDTVTRKRRKVLTVPDLEGDRFTALDFSADGRHLVTQGGAPQWRLFFWNWERSKPLASTSVVADFGLQEICEAHNESDAAPGSLSSGARTTAAQSSTTSMSHVTCVTVCPSDPLLIGVSGFGFMYFYRYQEGVLRIQPHISFARERTSNFLTHSWVGRDRVVASTQNGELLLIEAGVFRRILPVPPSTTEGAVNPAVLAIVPTRNGFIAGSDQGTVAIYETIGSANESYAIVYNVPVPSEKPGEVKSDDLGVASRPVATNKLRASIISDGQTEGEGGQDAPAKPLFVINDVTQGKISSTTESSPTVSGKGIRPAQLRLEAGRPEPRKDNSVVHLCIDQTEETVAMVTHGGQILAFNFASDWSKVSAEEPPTVLHVCQPFHIGGIIGLDCSVKKPYLATSGVDQSVRIWNTSTHRLETCEYFTSQPGALAIHPNGLYLVVCFPDKVRVLSILWNGLRERRVINLRNTTDVKYSVGGSYFAVAHGNIIHLYNSLTCDVHGQLRGHPQKINCFQWCATSPYPTDNSIISSSLDGIVINWNISEMRKETEYADKKHQFRYITADDRTLWAVSEPTSIAMDVQWKSTLHEMDRYTTSDIAANAAVTEYEFVESKVTSLLIAPKQRMLFGGMDDGSVKFMSFPLQVGVQEVPIVAHMGPVGRMVLSHDESTLYTISSDGTLFIFDAREDGRPLQRDLGYFSDDVLVLASEVEDHDITIESLRHTTEKLRTDIESDEKRRNHEQNTRLRERADEFKNELDTLDAEYEALLNAKAEQERAFVAVKLEKEGESAPQLEGLEREGQAEVQRLEDLCAELQHKLDQSTFVYEREVEDLLAEIQRHQEEDHDRFKDVVSKREKGLQKLEQQVQRTKANNAEVRQRLELDTDAEVMNVEKQNQAELNAIRERYLRMKGEGAIMRKNTLRMQKETDVHNSELQVLDNAKATLTEQLSELNETMAQLHQDIDERDAIIGEKERKIYDLKKLNQELEKHKFVLDYRIRQLKSQMEPRQREIAREHQRISERNVELDNLHGNNIALRQNIEELKAELAQQQQQIKQTLSHMKDFETYKSRVKRDIGEIAPAMQDAAMLRDVVERLYQRHVVARDGQRAAQVGQEIKDEFKSQVEYLSTSVEALSRKCEADQEQHRCEVSAMMMENLTLIREIHELRAELADLRNVSVTVADEGKRHAMLEERGKQGPPGRVALPTGLAGVKRPELLWELEENRKALKSIRDHVESLQQMLASLAPPKSAIVSLPPLV